jgi:hypothetical protein
MPARPPGLCRPIFGDLAKSYFAGEYRAHNEFGAIMCIK